jgi:hypothetical protein
MVLVQPLARPLDGRPNVRLLGIRCSDRHIGALRETSYFVSTELSLQPTIWPEQSRQEGPLILFLYYLFARRRYLIQGGRSYISLITRRQLSSPQGNPLVGTTSTGTLPFLIYLVVVWIRSNSTFF